MSDQTMVPLADAPVGLFRHDETFAIKTEYVSDNGWIHAYIVSSGEAFWGPSPQTVEGQRNLIVEPIDLEGMLAAAKAREEAAARHWMGEATTEDNILLNNLAGEYRDRTLAASEPPGEPSETGGSPVTPGA